MASWLYLDTDSPNLFAIAVSVWYSSHVRWVLTVTFGVCLRLRFTGSIGIRFPNKSLMYFRLYAIVFFLYEFIHDAVLPSLKPLLGSLLDQCLRSLALLLVYLRMTGIADTHKVLPHERPLAHLSLRCRVLDGVAMVYGMGSCHDTILHTLFAQSVGASELRNA